MNFPAFPLLFLAALLVNGALYLAVPFMQALMHQRALTSEKRPAVVEREIAFADPEPEKLLKREIREIKLEAIRPPNLTEGRPSTPGGGLKIDLSPAGGAGMALVSGGDRSGPIGSGTGGGKGSGIGAMVYEPGQTDSDARILGADQAPKYPPRAEREGITGFVDLLFVVNESGFAEQIAVLKEEPPSYGFAASAMEAVRRLRFQPAMLQKTAVKQKVKRRINFEQ
jgi:TonB family protein